MVSQQRLKEKVLNESNIMEEIGLEDSLEILRKVVEKKARVNKTVIDRTIKKPKKKRRMVPVHLKKLTLLYMTT